MKKFFIISCTLLLVLCLSSCSSILSSKESQSVPISVNDTNVKFKVSAELPQDGSYDDKTQAKRELRAYIDQLQTPYIVLSASAKYTQSKRVAVATADIARPELKEIYRLTVELERDSGGILRTSSTDTSMIETMKDVEDDELISNMSSALDEYFAEHERYSLNRLESEELFLSYKNNIIASAKAVETTQNRIYMLYVIFEQGGELSVKKTGVVNMGLAPQKPQDKNKLNIEVGDKSFTISLNDNPTVESFLELLPLTLDMGDLNGNEKYFYLPSGLPTDSRRVEHIEVGDFMLYGSDCLVLFYESFSTQYSYTPLGKIENPEGFSEALGGGNVQIKFS